MAIAEADIKFRLSGGAGNTDPAASLGGVMSSQDISSGSLHNLFDAVSGDESGTGEAEYRGIYILNNHGSLTWETVKVWIDQLSTSGDTEVDIALADEAINTTMETIADENTAPSGPSFSRPTTKAGGLAPGSIPAGQRKGIWIKRTVTAGAAPASDQASIRAEGDTAP